MPWNLFLDESGDLGFDFENKQPSRFLTIAVLAVSRRECAAAIRGAVKKTLKRKVNGGKKGQNRPLHELKGSSTAAPVKRYFYSLLNEVKFGVYAMTLNKQRVYEELHGTPQAKDRLYNYVARQVIEQIPFEQAVDEVNLIVDRSKGKRGIADFDQYIRRALESRLDPKVRMHVHHAYSHVDLGLSAADLFCWGVFRKYERDDTEWYDTFAERVIFDARYL